MKAKNIQYKGSKLYMTSRPEPLYVYRDPYRYVREVVSKLRMDGRYIKDGKKISPFKNHAIISTLHSSMDFGMRRFPMKGC